jgi:hypothetical protein
LSDVSMNTFVPIT